MKEEEEEEKVKGKEEEEKGGVAVDCCVKVVDWHLGMFHQSDRVVQCAVCSV